MPRSRASRRTRGLTKRRSVEAVGGGFGIRRRRRYGGLDGSRCLRRGRHRSSSPVCGRPARRLSGARRRASAVLPRFARRADDDDRVADRDAGTLGREQLEHGARRSRPRTRRRPCRSRSRRAAAHIAPFWPTATSQVAIAASVTPASTSGIRMTVAIRLRPFRRARRSMPATTSSVRAIAARSSTFEMLGLASPPVTRCDRLIEPVEVAALDLVGEPAAVRGALRALLDDQHGVRLLDRLADRLPVERGPVEPAQVDDVGVDARSARSPRGSGDHRQVADDRRRPIPRGAGPPCRTASW